MSGDEIEVTFEFLGADPAAVTEWIERSWAEWSEVADVAVSVVANLARSTPLGAGVPAEQAQP